MASRQATELKPVASGTFQYVQKQWEEGASDDTYAIDQVYQVLASVHLMNEFEERRTESELAVRAHGAGKLETIQAWVSLSDANIDKVMQSGFSSFGTAIAFSKDPILAIKEGSGASSHKCVLCRLQLGIPDKDYREIHNKIIVTQTKGVMPSFLVVWKRI